MSLSSHIIAIAEGVLLEGASYNRYAMMTDGSVMSDFFKKKNKK